MAWRQPNGVPICALRAILLADCKATSESPDYADLQGLQYCHAADQALRQKGRLAPRCRQKPSGPRVGCTRRLHARLPDWRLDLPTCEGQCWNSDVCPSLDNVAPPLGGNAGDCPFKPAGANQAGKYHLAGMRPLASPAGSAGIMTLLSDREKQSSEIYPLFQFFEDWNNGLFLLGEMVPSWQFIAVAKRPACGRQS